jgi:hypothetical protein
VKAGTHKAEVGARAGAGNYLKAGAETNSFGSATLQMFLQK